MNWKWLLMMVLPMLEMLGQQKVSEDANDTGKDDLIGQSILFGITIFRAVLKNDTGTLDKMLPSSARGLVTKDHFEPPAVEG